MVERFVESAGLISIGTGASIVTGTGTAFGGVDREGCQVWVQPAGAACFRIGTVAAVDPRGIYDDLELPLLHPWNGAPVVDQPYELVDHPALANGVSQAAVYACFAAFLERNMGLVGNAADDVDYSLAANANAVSGVLPAGNLPNASTTAEGISEFATAAEFRTGTDTARSLVVSEVWSAAAVSALTDATSISVNLADGFDFGGASNAALALGGNRTLSAPTNAKSGQKGILWFTASLSTRTLTLNAAWNLMTGVEAGPYSITTAQTLGIAYVVRGTTVYVTAILRIG